MYNKKLNQAFIFGFLFDYSLGRILVASKKRTKKRSKLLSTKTLAWFITSKILPTNNGMKNDYTQWAEVEKVQKI